MMLKRYIITVCIIGIFFCALLISSCNSPVSQHVTHTDDNYTIKVIDSCEYIECDYGIFDQRVYSLTHKGNCKFCKERNKK